MNAVTDQDDIIRLIAERPQTLEGYTVVAKDGDAGTVAADQAAVDDQHLVVHVGGRMFGTDVVVEAGVIDLIDSGEEQVHIDRIADWVKSSPKLKHFR